MGLRLGRHADDCPVTVAAADQLVRLPFFNGLDDADQAAVINAVEAWRP
jgi:dTDP-4-amino-4,6-dideoxygalactose transaminase